MAAVSRILNKIDEALRLKAAGAALTSSANRCSADHKTSRRERPVFTGAEGATAPETLRQTDRVTD
jgi:hypothetical protein